MTLNFNRVLEVVGVHVRAKFHQAECRVINSAHSALDFGQLYVDFDREYLFNGSTNRQADNGVTNYDFLHVRRTNLVICCGS